jgi:hypothetical protein
VDVKDVEEVLSLSEAVGANKAVLVCLNGWTEPAEIKAGATGLDLRTLTLEEALDLNIEEKWQFCRSCGQGLVVLDHDGAMLVDSAWLWWLAGPVATARPLSPHSPR